MRLALLSLVGLVLSAQQPTAVFNNFSPTVMGVTIGQVHCYFWFHVLPKPYDSEAACYASGVLQNVQASIPGVTTVESFDFDGGSIAWQLKPNATDPTRIDYQISGQAKTDAAPILKTGTI